MLVHIFLGIFDLVKVNLKSFVNRVRMEVSGRRHILRWSVLRLHRQGRCIECLDSSQVR